MDIDCFYTFMVFCQCRGEYEVAYLRAMSGLMAGKKNEVCANVILVSFFHGFQCLNLTFRD